MEACLTRLNPNGLAAGDRASARVARPVELLAWTLIGVRVALPPLMKETSLLLLVGIQLSIESQLTFCG